MSVQNYVHAVRNNRSGLYLSIQIGKRDVWTTAPTQATGWLHWEHAEDARQARLIEYPQLVVTKLAIKPLKAKAMDHVRNEA